MFMGRCTKVSISFFTAYTFSRKACLLIFVFFCLPVNTISFACIHLSMMRFRFVYANQSFAVLMIRWTGERERERNSSNSIANERKRKRKKNSNVRTVETWVIRWMFITWNELISFFFLLLLYRNETSFTWNIIDE